MCSGGARSVQTRWRFQCIDPPIRQCREVSKAAGVPSARSPRLPTDSMRSNGARNVHSEIGYSLGRHRVGPRGDWRNARTAPTTTLLSRTAKRAAANRSSRQSAAALSRRCSEVPSARIPAPRPTPATKRRVLIRPLSPPPATSSPPMNGPTVPGAVYHPARKPVLTQKDTGCRRVLSRYGSAHKKAPCSGFRPSRQITLSREQTVAKTDTT